MNKTPHIVGYWARQHGLTYADVVRHPEFSCSPPDLVRFNEGWNCADGELKEEQFTKLLADLREAAE